jgi:hypothetical protein
MKHLLLTRFAIPFPADNQRSRHGNNPDWLPRRYELLERYTLPSVESQTCKDFEWLLIANPNFPWIDHKRLESYTKVLWVDMEWDEAMGFEEAIRPYTEDEEWMLTSRLDSDDAVYDGFIEDTQAAFRPEVCWYTHPTGYVVKGDEAYFRRYPSSPFVSYSEPAAGARSVYHASHIYAGRGSRLVEVGSEPAWVQVDHGGNVKNSVARLAARGRLGCIPTSVRWLKRFACEWEGV